jgi:hypothetical protein
VERIDGSGVVEVLASADLFRFRLSGGPPDLTGRDLVLRVRPPRTGSLGECVVQRELADLGYPTPAVLRAGTLDDSRPHLIMVQVDGASMFEACGPARHVSPRT